VLLDRDHLLLADEAMPAAERLGVERRVGIIGRHVLAHDLGGVACNVETGLEAVLQPHAGNRLRADAVPGALALDERLSLRDLIVIRHIHVPRRKGSLDWKYRAPNDP
jgi:hypothetical protein